MRFGVNNGRMQTFCPCGSGESYSSCCRRLHDGEIAAATATDLMRARFCAFARRDAEYLLRTWAPRTRPRRLEFDAALTWVGLTIVFKQAGGLFDQTGTVEFRASYRANGQRGELHETSQFERVDGAWVYVDGAIGK